MEDNLRGPDCVVISPEAGLDLSAIYIHTAQAWSLEQAELYDDFLEEIFQDLAMNPNKGRPVANRPGLRSYVAKWRQARQGHRIFYQETVNGILVMRVLHTAMMPSKHITGE